MFFKTLSFLLALLIINACVISPIHAEIIELKSGEIFGGTITNHDDYGIEFSSGPDGNVVYYWMRDIKTIDFVPVENVQLGEMVSDQDTETTETRPEIKSYSEPDLRDVSVLPAFKEFWWGMPGEEIEKAFLKLNYSAPETPIVWGEDGSSTLAIEGDVFGQPASIEFIVYKDHGLLVIQSISRLQYSSPAEAKKFYGQVAEYLKNLLGNYETERVGETGALGNSIFWTVNNKTIEWGYGSSDPDNNGYTYVLLQRDLDRLSKILNVEPEEIMEDTDSEGQTDLDRMSKIVKEEAKAVVLIGAYKSGLKTVWQGYGGETHESDGTNDESLIMAQAVAEHTDDLVTMSEMTREFYPSGTGFIVDPAGLIVTNFHVVEEQILRPYYLEDLRVKLRNGDVFDNVHLVAYNRGLDICILKIDAKNLPTVLLSTAKKVEVGQKIVAIGHPFGLENTVSDGLISGLRPTAEPEYQYLQISAPISPGNSGGPVFDLESGKVLGIASFQYVDGQNLNFAIPIDLAKSLLPLDVAAVTKLLKDIDRSLERAEELVKNRWPLLDKVSIAELDRIDEQIVRVYEQAIDYFPNNLYYRLKLLDFLKEKLRTTYMQESGDSGLTQEELISKYISDDLHLWFSQMKESLSLDPYEAAIYQHIISENLFLAGHYDLWTDQQRDVHSKIIILLEELAEDVYLREYLLNSSLVSFDLYEAIATMYTQKGDYSQAIQAYQKTWAYFSDIEEYRAYVFFRIGDCYMLDGRLDEAVKWQKRSLHAVAQAPGSDSIRLPLAKAYMLKDETDNAIKTLNDVTANELDYEQEETYYRYKGICQYRLKDYKQAIDDLTKALKLELEIYDDKTFLKEKAEVRYYLGKAFLFNKQRKKAKEQLEFLEQLDKHLYEELKDEIERNSGIIQLFDNLLK